MKNLILFILITTALSSQVYAFTDAACVVSDSTGKVVGTLDPVVRPIATVSWTQGGTQIHTDGGIFFEKSIQIENLKFKALYTGMGDFRLSLMIQNTEIEGFQKSLIAGATLTDGFNPGQVLRLNAHGYLLQCIGKK
jgi:hypothetical protein